MSVGVGMQERVWHEIWKHPALWTRVMSEMKLPSKFHATPFSACISVLFSPVYTPSRGFALRRLQAEWLVQKAAEGTKMNMLRRNY
jgi:hypothetical protein